MANPWSESETLALVSAWGAEVAQAQARGEPKSALKQSAAIHRAFLKSTGSTAEERPLEMVTTRRSALRFLFEHIRDFNETQEVHGRPTWFQLSPMHRVRIRRRWKDRRVKNDMTWKVFASMARWFAELPSTLGVSPSPDTKKKKEKKKTRRRDASHNATEDAPACRRWSHSELMALTRSFTDMCREYPEYARQVRDARLEDLYTKYLGYGGLKERSPSAVVRQARYMLDAYRFVVTFNTQARTNREIAWHHQSEQARASHAGRYSGNKRLLLHMDSSMFAALDQTPSIQAVASTPKRKRSLSPPTSPRPSGQTRRKRRKTQSTEFHRVTESRHYSVSSCRDVVTVNKARNIQSDHLADSDSDMPTSLVSGSSEDHGFQKTPSQAVGLLRGHLGGHNKLKATFRPFRRRRPPLRTTHNDYQSLLEHTVITMSTQLAQIDRRLTEARISENQGMLVSVLRACRQSSNFGSAPTALAREMLARAGTNLQQIVELVGQQQEKDGELLRRLLSSLGDSSS